MNTIIVQLSSINNWTLLWMNWMVFSFICSIAFIRQHKTARYVFGALILTIPIGAIIFYLTKTIFLLGIAHWLVWGPLVLIIYKKEISGKKIKLNSPYNIWLYLLTITITICLGLDLWDLIQIAADKKY